MPTHVYHTNFHTLLNLYTDLLIAGFEIRWMSSNHILIDDECASSSSSSSSSSSAAASETHTGQYCRFVITVNNPAPIGSQIVGKDEAADYNSFKDWCQIKLINKLKLNIRYAAWCLEKGEGLGTPHIQCFLYLQSKMRYTAMKNKIRSIGGWVDIGKEKEGGTGASDYILRRGNHVDKPGLLGGPWTFGTEVTGTGEHTKSNTLHDCINAMKAGKRKIDLVDNFAHIIVRHGRGLTELESLINKKKVRTWMTECHILTGVAGSGKSYTAMQEATKYLADHKINETPFFLALPAKVTDTVWWGDQFTGYEGESCVIINDFYGHFSLDYFKNLIDRYGFSVNKKNCITPFLARAVWITSNQSWKAWWGAELMKNANNEDAVSRRITSTRDFKNAYSTPPSYASSSSSSSSSSSLYRDECPETTNLVTHINDNANVEHQDEEEEVNHANYEAYQAQQEANEARCRALRDERYSHLDF